MDEQHKKRGRGWVRGGCVAAAVVALLLGAGLGWMVWRGRLAPSVTVDYVARLNEWWRVFPEEERAEAVYLEAVRAGMPEPKVLKDPEDPEFGEREAEVGAGPWHADWAVVRAWLEMPEQQRAAAVWREGAQRAVIGFEYGGPGEERWLRAIADRDGVRWDPALVATRRQPPIVFNEEEPFLGEMRRGARLLKSDAFASAARGDFAAAGANIRAMLGMARQLRMQPTLLTSLLGVGMEASAVETALEIAAFFGEQIPAGWRAEMASALEEHCAGRALAPRMDWDRAVQLDFAQRIYSDDGHGGGVVTARGLRSFAALDPSRGGVFVDRWLPVPDTLIALQLTIGRGGRASFENAVNEVFDATERLRERGVWEMEASAEWATLAASDELDWFARFWPMPTGILMLSTRNAVASVGIGGAGVEISAFVLRALDAGPEGVMPERPADPFDGRPVRAAWGADGLVVYSIGVDRDDDGGRRASQARAWEPAAEAAELAQRRRQNYDGDWVIWPVEVGEE